MMSSKKRSRSRSQSAQPGGPRAKIPKITTTTTIGPQHRSIKPAKISAISSKANKSSITNRSLVKAKRHGAVATKEKNEMEEKNEMKEEKMRTVLERAKVYKLGSIAKHELNHDVLLICKHFLDTCRFTERQIAKAKVLVLPEESPLVEAYEAKAKELSELKKPILVREALDVKMPNNSVSSATGFAFEKLGFHGTPNANVLDIVTNGFKEPERHGNYGKCVYVAHEANYSHAYTQDGLNGRRTLKQIIGCRALLFEREMFDTIYAANDTKRVLPIVVFQYPS